MKHTLYKTRTIARQFLAIVLCFMTGMLMQSCTSDKEPDVWEQDTYKIMFSGDTADFHGGITIGNYEGQAYLMSDRLEGHNLFSPRGFNEDWTFTYRYAARKITPKVDFACSALHLSDNEVKHFKVVIIRLHDGEEIDRYEFETHSYPPHTEIDKSAYLCRIKI